MLQGLGKDRYDLKPTAPQGKIIPDRVPPPAPGGGEEHKARLAAAGVK